MFTSSSGMKEKIFYLFERYSIFINRLWEEKLTGREKKGPFRMGGIILDSDQISAGISKRFIRLPEEEQFQFLSRVSHLHHQNQNIRQIGDLSPVRNLTVLYIYDNR